MGARLVGDPHRRYFDNSGAVLSGGKLYYYEPGTTTPKTVWKDVAKAATHTSPIVLESDGTLPAPVFAEGMYDTKLTDSDDVTIETTSSYGDNKSAVLTDLNENLVSNGSFETDTDADGEPDNWTETEASGTVARVTAENYHAAASLKFTAAGTGTFVTSDKYEMTEGRDLEISFATYASNASAQPKVEILWYDSAQASISNSTVFDSDQGTTPTSWEYIEELISTPPANARYFEVKITGNDQATTYNVWFDDVRVSQPKNAQRAYVAPYGLILSTDADTAHDINVTAGGVLDSTLAKPLILSSEITKRFDAAWAIGDDNGGDDGSGLPADDIYYVWLIGDSDRGLVDVLGSTSDSSPTMPSGWDLKRLIGCVRTDSSNNIVAFTHRGNRFEWDESIADVTDSTLTDVTYETGTATVPPNSDLLYHCHINGGQDDTLAGLIRTTGSTESLYTLGIDPYTGSTMDEMWFEGAVLVDASSQFEYAARFTASTPTITIRSRGCIMWTRDNP